MSSKLYSALELLYRQVEEVTFLSYSCVEGKANGVGN